MSHSLPPFLLFSAVCFLANGIRAAEDGKVDPIQKHQESLARIKSIHYKMESWIEPSELLGLKERTLATVNEVWAEGSRERSVSRAYVRFLPKGVERFKDGLLSITVLTDREVRRIDGWDPSAPLELPLDFGRNPKGFTSVLGQLTDRRPTQPSFVSLFGFGEVPSLSRVMELSQLTPGSSNRSGTFCVEIKTSKASSLVGTKIYFSKQMDYLVSHSETKNGKTMTVEEFAQTDGIWYPKRVRGISSSAGFISTSNVVECEINHPIAPGILDMTFPEGSMVREPEKKLIHIWGKTGPLETFQSEEAYTKRIQERARAFNELKSSPSPNPIPRPSPSPNPIPTPTPNRMPWIVGGIVVIFIGFVGLFLLRQKLKSPANPA